MVSADPQYVSKGFPAVLPLLEDSPVVIEALPDYVSSASPRVISPDLADRAMLEDSALEAARQADFFSLVRSWSALYLQMNLI